MANPITASAMAASTCPAPKPITAGQCPAVIGFGAGQVEAAIALAVIGLAMHRDVMHLGRDPPPAQLAHHLAAGEPERSEIDARGVEMPTRLLGRGARRRADMR